MMSSPPPPYELTCFICGELHRAAVSVRGCMHSFCSECIRLHLARQKLENTKRVAECPMCNHTLITRSAIFSSEIEKVLEPNIDL